MANKVKYGLSNVYYAVITKDENDNITYGTPVKWAGAINLNATASGETSTMYADNMPYFEVTANNGYTGTLETALVPESFKKDVLGELEDAGGIVYEKSDVIAKQFALLFQFEGDETATRHVLYNCTASRPDVASQTKEASITPVTETLNFSALPRPNDYITKGRIADTTQTAYTNWFTAVQVPEVTTNTPANDGE